MCKKPYEKSESDSCTGNECVGDTFHRSDKICRQTVMVKDNRGPLLVIELPKTAPWFSISGFTFDENLPWDFIQNFVSKQTLMNEYDRLSKKI